LEGDEVALKILIVDDNESDIYLLRHALDERGEEYDLIVLDDGEKAIQFVDRHRLTPHAPEPCVILLDLHLPKRDGLEVLRAIRREPAISHIHVVLVTSSASPLEQAAIRAAGADLRVKPTRLSEFAKLAADLIEICKSFGSNPVPAMG
jgi:CheY-like chemotaxis protein